MLKLTKKADYGLIALKHLASLGGSDSVSAKEMADLYHVPLPLFSKILQKLTREGFLQSVQGTHGGYRLARDPRSISTLEVIRAIDGPVLLTACFTQGEECEHTQLCPVREPLRKLHEEILHLLERMTVADLAHDEDAPAARRGIDQYVSLAMLTT